MRVRDNCGSSDCGEVAILSEGKCICCEDKLSIKTILNSDDALRAKQKERCYIKENQNPSKMRGNDVTTPELNKQSSRL